MAKKKATKTYTVVVHYEGSISYDVDAKNEEEAEEAALDLFGDEDASSISANIGDVEACDCWEDK